MLSSGKVYKDDEYYKNFLSKNWRNDSDKQLASLKALENHMAKKQDRKEVREIADTDLGGDYGSYSYENPNVLKIDLKCLDKDYNQSKNERLEGMSGYFAMATGLHEGAHACQHAAINHKVKNNPYSEKDLKSMGRDFIYGDVGCYIERPTESDAHKRTLNELSEIREKIVKFESPDELKKFDEFLIIFKEQIKEKENEACAHHEIKTFEKAKEKTLIKIDNRCETLKDLEKTHLAKIENAKDELRKRKAEYKKMSPESKKGMIKKEIRVLKTTVTYEKASLKSMLKDTAENHKCSKQEVLRQIKSVDSGKGLIVKERNRSISLSHNAKPSQLQAKPQNPESAKEPRMTDKGRVTAVIEAQKGLDVAERQLADPNLKPERRQTLEADKIKKEREHSEAVGEILKRPNSYQLIGKIENAQRTGRISREKLRERDPDSPRER